VQSIPIEKLAFGFWAWRARSGQYTSDDVPRMERPLGGVEKQRKELAEFEERWRAVDDPKAPVHQSGFKAGGANTQEQNNQQRLETINAAARQSGLSCLMETYPASIRGVARNILRGTR
jgi:hypothetical protein